MKRKNCIRLLPLFIVIILSSAICKKDDVQNIVPGTCRIATATGIGSSPATISYQSNGKIAKIEYDDVVRTYTYGTNSIIILSKEGGSFDERKTLTLNNDGLPLNVRGDYNQAGTQWYNDAFEYIGKEVAKRIESDYTGAAPDTITYTWAGGNLIKEQSRSYGTVNYAYYTDKTILAGDHFYFEQLLTNGYQYVLNKNLLKSAQARNYPADNFYYTYDTDEKIISYKENNRATNNYTYKCN